MNNVGNNVNPNFGQMCPDIVHQGYYPIHNPYIAFNFSLTFFSLQGEHIVTVCLSQCWLICCDRYGAHQALSSLTDGPSQYRYLFRLW